MTEGTSTATRERGEATRVLCLIGLLVVLSTALGVGVLQSASVHYAGFLLPWWALALFFALTESAVFHVQIKQEAQTVSISELPLVVGLFFASPDDLVIGRLVGSFMIFALYRRSSLLKSSFNTALLLTETLLAVLIFQSLAGGVIGGGDPRDWIAAMIAVLVANAVGFIAIGLVIAIYEDGLVWSTLLRESITGQAFAPGVVVMALVAVDALASDSRSGWLVTGAAVTLILCYRLYASLFDRHVNLERLYHFSQNVADSPANDTVLKLVLEQATELLKSSHATLHLAPSPESGTRLRVTLGSDGKPERTLEPADMAPDWLHDQVIGASTAVVLPRRSREPHIRQWLTKHKLRDALAVPLGGTDRVMGMLVVGGRLGEVRTYDSEDVLMLETLANHASVALQKGELIEQLQHEALHDTLTELPNRAQLQRQLSQELLAGVSSSVPLAIMILDLDGFKDVNDILGHQQGDLVLIEVAERLLRATGEDGLVARLGGDEFAVLIPRLEGREHAEAISRRLVSSLEMPMELQGMQFEVGGSVGIALFPEHGTDAAALMKRADLAMYEAKTTATKVRFYETTNDEPGARRLALVAELRTALSNGQLEVFVQPQLDLASGQIESLEALVRWNHPTLGWVPPDEFIPIAERSGLINSLTTLVLDRALGGLAAYHSSGLSIAVNLSPRSLNDAELVDTVQALLEKWAIPPQQLTLEVTEGAVMTDPHRAIALLGRLRSVGVRLSIDDFGTGYSSLSYLTQLPVDEVKIDKSFVTDLTRSVNDLAIVRSIIGLGATMGLDIVAEGVEDAASLKMLRELGCTRVQGWHVARPMPMRQASEWLSRHSAEAEAA